jgi:hypothetical protein
VSMRGMSTARIVRITNQQRHNSIISIHTHANVVPSNTYAKVIRPISDRGTSSKAYFCINTIN